MKSWISTALTVLLCVADMKGQGVVAAGGPHWIRDFNLGRQKAVEEKKDLMVVFTGHGWCANCEILDREVFQNRDFVQAIEKLFVCVELDFKFGESAQERKREQIDRDLQNRYLAPAVPTVFLLDKEGVPYAIFEGYKSGMGPQKMLALFDRACAARLERDRNFTAAAKSAGTDRAKLLNVGLEAVAPLLGSLEERGDDPVLTFYPTVVAEIRRLDPAARSPFAAAYEARQKKRDEWITTRDSTFGKLREFDGNRNYKGAIAFIASALQDLKTPDVRWKLEFARQTYLEWDGQYEAGLENARRLLGEPNRTPQDRETLLDRESYNLWNSGRFAEALAQHDRRIREAQGSPAKRLRLLGRKAQMVRPGVAPEMRIKAWRDYLEAAKPKSEDWLTATMFLALELRKDGDARQALQLQREFIAAEPTNLRIKLQAAESLVALGEKDAARQMIREIETALPSKPERQSDKDFEKFLRARIARIQDQLAKVSK
jgi:thioredoxin-related protein